VKHASDAASETRSCKDHVAAVYSLPSTECSLPYLDATARRQCSIIMTFYITSSYMRSYFVHRFFLQCPENYMHGSSLLMEMQLTEHEKVLMHLVKTCIW
jgi:hypothetical protein